MTDQRCNSALGEENEEDVEGMKQHKGSSSKTVNSTRNALRMARKRPLEALLTGWVVNQKLANPERHLDVAKGHSQHADDRTDELKRLNRSIFRPVITFNKDAKRAAQEAKVLQRYEEEREEGEKVTRDSKSLGSGVDLWLPGGGNRGGAKCGASRCRSTVAKRYQVEAAASDDEPEDELDNNLDEISDVAKTLKALGTALGQELDHQNNRIERIEDKTVNLDNRVFRNTELKRI